MKHVALVVGGIFALMYLTWFFYLAVENLIRAKRAGNLKWQAAIFAYPMAFVGIVFDSLLNLTIGTLLFVELPRQGLFTARLDRHCAQPTWRGAIARWICTNMLDPFDATGTHCKCDKGGK